MQHRYLPLTESDKKEMLQVIGVESIEELFSDIPEQVRFTGEYAIKPAKSESSLMKELAQLASQNKNSQQYASFLGAGVYDHYKPIIVDHVISRSEFYTAYTPYQPEISQGALQAIFEFQTMIAELTGMDLANSSMYDGATALAEAGTLAAAQTKRKKLLVSETIHPESIAVVQSYAAGQGVEVVLVPSVNGITDMEALTALISEEIAAVLVQYPNFYGQIEPLDKMGELAHQHKALFVSSSNPLALAVLTPPGQFGADIVVGDAQPFGIPEAFGGPHCGYFATTKKLMRKIPGRIVGETKDTEGKRGYVLTLQAREQHIRREKATSNICSNQALNALAAAVAMTALGKTGVQEMAYQNMAKAHYARKAFEEAGFRVAYHSSQFNEFVVDVNTDVQTLNAHLLSVGIIGGLSLAHYQANRKTEMLVAVTEQRTKEEIDLLVATVATYVKEQEAQHV